MKKIIIFVISLFISFLPTSILYGFAPDGFYFLALTWCAGRKPNSYYTIFILIGLLKDIFGFYLIGYNILLYITCCFLFNYLLNTFNHHTYLFRWIIFNLSAFFTIMPGPELFFQITNLGWLISIKAFIINLALSFLTWHFIGYDDSAIIGYSRAYKICRD